jgi:hypothetical protein
LLDAIDGVVRELRQDFTKIEHRVKSIQFRSSDETVERRGALSPESDPMNK